VSNPTPEAGTDVTVTAQLADGNGNPVGTSGLTVNWSSTNGGSFASPSSVTVNGVATVTFTTSTVAPTTHTVTGDDGTLSGTSAGFTTTAGAASAAQTTATVPAGSVGLATTVTITVRDGSGNVRTAGGDAGLLSVTVTGVNTATPVVVDVGGGVYTASYTPATPGFDVIDVTLSGTPINGSPQISVVSP
jgi:hypothetical protein